MTQSVAISDAISGNDLGDVAHATRASKQRIAVAIIGHHPVERLRRSRGEANDPIPLRDVDLRTSVPAKDDGAESELAMAEYLMRDAIRRTQMQSPKGRST